MKKRKELTEEEKLWVREMTLFVVGISIIGIITAQLIFIQNILHLSITINGISGFAATRIIIFVLCIVYFPTGAVLGELAYSRVKKRSFRPRNVLIIPVMLGTWLLMVIALLTTFDLLLSGVSFLIQFPLIAVSGSIPTLILAAATSKIKRINDYVKKTFQ